MHHVTADCVPAASGQIRGQDATDDQDDDEEDDGSDMDWFLEYRHYKARQGREYWDWCHHEGEWYWWPVESPEDAKTETTNWKFRHRYHEVAYGNDPLMFFDDWDSEAGDVSEPTPFGKAFDRARNDPAAHARVPPERAEAWTEIEIPPPKSMSDEAWSVRYAYTTASGTWLNPTSEQMAAAIAAEFREDPAEVTESVASRSDGEMQPWELGVSD
ncbi:hypothetical protein Micbo1qcDRAFT_156613, partial [Microdochium bolleyi]